jgi:integrase
VQKLLGHAKFETTMNIYTHVMPDIKIRDVKNINKFL